MNENIKKEVKSLQNGIKGYCLTNRFKLKIIAIVSAIVLTVALAISSIIIYNNVWDYKVYVFAHSNTYYKMYFYQYTPVKELLSEKNISKSKFEKRTNISIVDRRDLTNEDIEKLNLSNHVNLDQLSELKKNQFYMVVINEEGDCLYAGEEMREFCKTLLDSGF